MKGWKGTSAMTEEQFKKEYYQQAVGFRIVAATVSPDGFPQLICHKGKEEIVLEVSRDEEGNGAGFLFGLPRI